MINGQYSLRANNDITILRLDDGSYDMRLIDEYSPDAIDYIVITKEGTLNNNDVIIIIITVLVALQRVEAQDFPYHGVRQV